MCLSAVWSLCVISTPLQSDSSAVLPNVQATVKLNEPEQLGWEQNIIKVEFAQKIQVFQATAWENPHDDGEIRGLMQGGFIVKIRLSCDKDQHHAEE